MPYISKKSRRFIFSFMGAIFVALIINAFVTHYFDFTTALPGITYCCIVTAWIITIQRRVPFSFIKGYLILGGSSVIMLFLIRQMRWDYFYKILIIDRHLWYSYYIPITVLPLFSILMALRVGKEAEDRKKSIDFIIIISWAVLVCLTLTNDLHNFVFDVELYTTARVSYSYGIGYWIIVAWIVIVTLASLIILVKRSRNSSVRSLSWIPIAIYCFFGLFNVIYVLNDSKSPTLFGLKLYMMQEIYAMMYIGMWEASLRIGLIPSNSDYDDLFKLANVNAAIADTDHTLKYKSNNAIDLESPQVERAEKGGGLKLDENRRVKSLGLEIGSVLWVEDHSAINELNMDLTDAIERINEENSLLEIENEIKAQKQAIEIRSRLYDSISDRTRHQLEIIEDVLYKAGHNEISITNAIKRCSVLGAYVKRQANLSILAQQYKKLKLEELRYAIRESLENVKLFGIDSNVSGIKADTEFDGELLILAYEIFEATIEAALPGVETLSCILLGNDGIKLEILMDTPRRLPDYSRFDVEKHGAKIEILYEEEGIYVRFYAEQASDDKDDVSKETDNGDVNPAMEESGVNA